MRAVIAIDGAAGSGKSTLASRLALELGLPHLNTGQMYRALALAAHRRGVDPDDGEDLEALVRSISFDLDRTLRPPSLLIEGEPPSDALTSPEVESTVSRVARHPEVRTALRAEQRRLIGSAAVVEGRDIGTVVVPDAAVKIFLVADRDERIGRRSEERAGQAAPVGEALVDRDRADARTNPLVPAAGAFEIDTTHLDADAVLAAALEIVRPRLERLEP